MLNIDSIIDFIFNINLSLFGIGITILTVLLSFVITKKDEVKVYSDVYKSGQGDPTIKGKISLSIKYIKKLRKIIAHIITICIISLISILTSWGFNIINCHDILIYISLGLTILLIGYIIVLLWNIISFFWKYTKV